MMSIDKISFNKVYPTGLYMNHRIGLEASITPEDDPLECMKQLKELADKMNLETNPSYAMAMAMETPEVPIIPKQSPKEERIGVFAEDIASCQDLKTLETYKYLVQKDETLKAAYIKRLGELSE